MKVTITVSHPTAESMQSMNDVQLIWSRSAAGGVNDAKPGISQRRPGRPTAPGPRRPQQPRSLKSAVTQRGDSAAADGAGWRRGRGGRGGRVSGVTQRRPMAGVAPDGAGAAAAKGCTE
ncbi:hypothetical protein COCOBI_02-8570 [Coccomyxa sp. Obi]|nr:hypothetical protein COCOBI_02-8570 [Coccomyxa sp. Obi]